MYEVTRGLRLVVVVAGVLGVGCGVDTTGDTTTTSEPTVATTTSAPTTTTTLVDVQPAVWPAPETAFASPEEAARSFVETVLDVPALLGEFQQGDSRSGEMTVFSPSGGGGASERGLLLLRQFGSANGWFVLAAVNDVPTITVPDSPVPAAPLRVTGTAIGFEATIIISAWLPGAVEPLDRRVTMAGEMGVAGPFDVQLDLSKAPAGSAVAIVVTGSVGLETDPGDFAAVPVTIAG